MVRLLEIIMSALPNAADAVAADVVAQAVATDVASTTGTEVLSFVDTLIDKAGDIAASAGATTVQKFLNAHVADMPAADQAIVVEWVRSDPRVGLVFAKYLIGKWEAKLTATAAKK